MITIIIGAGYYFLVGNKSTDLSEFVDSNATQSLTQQTDKILEDTRRINQFTLDSSIFSDKRFTSLVNTRVELGEISTGRSNPFEPVN